MQITRQRLRQYASTFREVLDALEVSTSSGLERMCPTVVEVPNSQDNILFEERPSNGGTAFTASYQSPGVGLPIEIRGNQTLEYFTIICKMDEPLPYYKGVGPDRFGNLVQCKKFDNYNLANALQELDDLAGDE